MIRAPEVPMTRRIVLIAALLVALVGAPIRSQEAPKKRASVILFIGDGMGISQLTLGRLAAQARGERYHLDRFRTIGLSSCQSLNWKVTDSAAAATALATGFRTNNQVVGLDPDGKRLTGLVEVAHAQGLATGVVTTTRITHATPAGFYAHAADRDDEGPIAAQLVEALRAGYPDVAIGGGLRHFDAGRQSALREAGYELVTDPTQLAAAKGPKVVGLLANSHYPFAIERAQGAPDLAAITRKAVELLQDRPFFLMVEGGRIDHACHQHDAPACIGDQLDLDRAIGWALDLAERRDDLLVVVTADHATADLGITENVRLADLLRVQASSEALTRGRGVDAGDADQATAFVDAVKTATGVTLTPDEVRLVWSHADDHYWASTALGHVVSSRYGVEFYPLDLQQTQMTNTHGHDGAMVGVFAAGRGAERFAGVYENLEIARRIAQVMDLPLPSVQPVQAPARRAF
jgi:alkaline phosphatase